MAVIAACHYTPVLLFAPCWGSLPAHQSPAPGLLHTPTQSCHCPLGPTGPHTCTCRMQGTRLNVHHLHKEGQYGTAQSLQAATLLLYTARCWRSHRSRPMTKACCIVESPSPRCHLTSHPPMAHHVHCCPILTLWIGTSCSQSLHPTQLLPPLPPFHQAACPLPPLLPHAAE